ncbi:hypothetical protein MNBD_GAMMA12-3902 [hydrothermal vent metagenome]|uniref:Uncharacterized protein n=1 Tax=hydrothermal vent metagenome TaxID=652676 RepID=A0A3B0Z4L0_9ZZZZ
MLANFELNYQRADSVGQYVVSIVEGDEDLQDDHLKDGVTEKSLKKTLDQIAQERKKLSKIADDKVAIFVNFIGKEKLTEKKSDINTLAAAFKDYEVIDAYSEKRKRKRAGIAVEIWDFYTDDMWLLKSGSTFLYEEGASRDTITSKMIGVGFNKQIRDDCKSEKNRIKPLFRSKNVQIISKIPKNDPHANEDPWKEAAVIYGTGKKFLDQYRKDCSKIIKEMGTNIFKVWSISMERFP